MIRFNAAKIEAEVGRCDFIDDVDNIYRTEDFIITQEINICEIGGEMQVMSKDRFYPRTMRRDTQYNNIFASRGQYLEGKRLKATIVSREYVF